MQRLCIINEAWLNSPKLPNKLLLEVHGESLLRCGCANLCAIQKLTNVPALIAICPLDTILYDIAREYDLEIFPISPDQSDNPELSSYRHLASRFDRVIDINILCRPFISNERLVELVQYAQKTDHAFVTVQPIHGSAHGSVWDSDGKLLVGAEQTFYTANNLAYVASVADVASTEKRAQAKPWPINLSYLDRIDVNGQADLDFAWHVANFIKLTSQ